MSDVLIARAPSGIRFTAATARRVLGQRIVHEGHRCEIHRVTLSDDRAEIWGELVLAEREQGRVELPAEQAQALEQGALFELEDVAP